MKSIYLILIVLFISCSPAKIKDFDKDYTQDLVGKIKSMTIKNYEYKFIKKDTVFLAKNTFLKFDTNNKVINESIATENAQEEHIYKYENALLVEKKSISDNKTSLTTYKYDESHNQIEEKSFDEKRVFSLKSQLFDHYQNPIEKKISYFGVDKALIKIEYDYKKRILISKTTVDTFSFAMISTKYFNKKGYIIKSSPENSAKNNDYFTFEIDKKGNLTKKTFYKSDDSVIEIVTYKNTYDKAGNIIIRDRFLDGKLIEKTTYEIVYY